MSYKDIKGMNDDLLYKSDTKYKNDIAVIEQKLSNDDYINYLTSDIIQNKLLHQFSNMLPADDFINANDFASNCIDCNKECRKVLPRKVKDWISNALKTYNIILLYYYQKNYGAIETKVGDIYDSQIYELFKKESDLIISLIGRSFGEIYKCRNNLEHTLYIDNKNKEIKFKRRSTEDIQKKLIDSINRFKDALTPFFKVKFK